MRFDDRGALIRVPGDVDARQFFSVSRPDLPLVLRYSADDQDFVLAECTWAGGTVIGGGESRIRARRVLVGSRDHDYLAVDGMSSDVAGIQRWTRMTSVTSAIESYDPPVLNLRCLMAGDRRTRG